MGGANARAVLERGEGGVLGRLRALLRLSGAVGWARTLLGWGLWRLQAARLRAEAVLPQNRRPGPVC